uniref:Uncharacterized protein n=1 Tax=Plectus sambesii TaxID=2011161 RepID=A0A914UXK5_9BILA
LPSTETVSRVHKFNQKLVRQKCWCGPRCAFGSLEPGWLHCSECADKLLSSHSFAFLMESRF